jgi:predicted ATP-grasp superfamily ATP-dependent carboligase
MEDLPHRFPATGKAIVYARRGVTLGDTRPWLEDPSLADIPWPGEHIAAGHPICTIFATAANASDCERSLLRRAERFYAELPRARGQAA